MINELLESSLTSTTSDGSDEGITLRLSCSFPS
jgi:hypothetical protein